MDTKVKLWLQDNAPDWVIEEIDELNHELSELKRPLKTKALTKELQQPFNDSVLKRIEGLQRHDVGSADVSRVIMSFPELYRLAISDLYYVGVWVGKVRALGRIKKNINAACRQEVIDFDEI